MGFGVLVYHAMNDYPILVMPDDSRYSEIRDALISSGIGFVGGKPGIPESEVEGLVKKVSLVLGRRNEDRSVSLEVELKQIFDPAP